jgi:hypothetical protein
MKTTKCYRCRATIWYGETEKGKKVPMCGFASPKGKVVAIDPEADVPMVRWLKKDEEVPEETRRYHVHLGPMCRVPKGKKTARATPR